MSDNDQLAQTLERLLDRIDSLEKKVDDLSESLTAVRTFSGRAGLLGEAAGDTAAFFYKEAEARGIDPIARSQAGLELAEKLSSPENMALVHKLLDKTDTLEIALNAIDQIDTDDLATLAEKGAGTVAILAKLVASPEFTQLMGAADPKALAVTASAGTALVETRSQRIEPVGPFGAFLKLRDPDIQRAVGFSLAVAKRFGQKLA